MCWIIVISLLVITLFLVWASADIGSNIYLKTICKGDTEEQVAALTFDDGPDEVMTERVLDVLKRHDIKATFFLIGEKVDKFPIIGLVTPNGGRNSFVRNPVALYIASLHFCSSCLTFSEELIGNVALCE